MNNQMQTNVAEQSSFSVKSSAVQPDESRLQEFIREVESFEIDPGQKLLKFAGRLARENNWTVEFAERVVMEYKRFCILAIQAGHPVTPSEQVDQAWHLHLTYTRSYWERFCGQVLKQPLHHNPTAGGVVEGGKFRDWYSKTLESYRRIFKAEPPKDVWPSPTERFQHAGSWQWVNAGRAWVVPKKPVMAVAALLAVIGAVFTLTSYQPFRWNAQISSSTFLAGIPPFSWNGGEFLTFYFGLICLILIVLWQARRRAVIADRSHQTPVDPKQLSREEIAVLAGGETRLAELAIAELYSEGHIKIESSSQTKSTLHAVGSGPSQPGLTKKVFKEIRRSEKRSEKPDVLRRVQPRYTKRVARLESLGLRHRSMWYSLAGNWLIAAVIGLGVVRAIQGISTNHPIGFLIASMIVFAIVGGWVNHRANPNTQAGEEILRQLRTTPTPPIDQPQGTGSAAMLMSVALLGSAAFVGQPEFESLNMLIGQIESNPKDSVGGGCSGGGGCGGCGGCGG